MKRMIVNADDFGLSKSINKGIIYAYRKGIVTSASLMVNMPGFGDTVDLIRDNPGLDVGLHINFFRGRPILLSNMIGSLIDKDGLFFHDILKIIRRIYKGSIKLEELESECEAQIKKAKDYGITITHIDSEKHLHLLPPVYKIVARLAKKYKISKIRNINEFPYIQNFGLWPKHILNPSFHKAMILQFFSMRNRKINSLHSIKTVDYSFGMLDCGNMTLNKLKKLIMSLKNGTTELLCHPGYIGEEWKSFPLNKERYYINSKREEELRILLSPCLKEIISKTDIKLASYKEL